MPNKLHFYTKYSKEKIKITAKPFASGGEGAIYAIASPRAYKHLVAKMYYPEKRTLERVRKMEYLIQNPPIELREDEHPSIGWVKDLIYKDDQFVGILLVRIEGKKLTKLTLSKLRRRAGEAWKRFAFGQKEALKLRLHACFNLAVIIQQIHESERYVLVDLKPDNVLMQPNGLMAVVDMDSVEVIENGEAIFSAPVATPEYTPPEYYQDEKLAPIEETWDRFSLGVIFYQLLFGLHPFAASCHAPYDNLVGLNDKVQYGLFVHHPEKQHLFKVIPPPHQRFYESPKELQDFFQDCFVAGDKAPIARPSALDWCLMLAELLNLPFAQFPKIDIPPSDLYFLPSEFMKDISLRHSIPHLSKNTSNTTIEDYKNTNPYTNKKELISILQKQYKKYLDDARPFFLGSLVFFISILLLPAFFVSLMTFGITVVILLGLMVGLFSFFLKFDTDVLQTVGDKILPRNLHALLGINRNQFLRGNKTVSTIRTVNQRIDEQEASLEKLKLAIQATQSSFPLTHQENIEAYISKRIALDQKNRSFQQWLDVTEKQLLLTREKELLDYKEAAKHFQQQLKQDTRYHTYSFRSYGGLKVAIEQKISHLQGIKLQDAKALVEQLQSNHKKALEQLAIEHSEKEKQLQITSANAKTKLKEKLNHLKQNSEKELEQLMIQHAEKKEQLQNAITTINIQLKKEPKHLQKAFQRKIQQYQTTQKEEAAQDLEQFIIIQNNNISRADYNTFVKKKLALKNERNRSLRSNKQAFKKLKRKLAKSFSHNLNASLKEIDQLPQERTLNFVSNQIKKQFADFYQTIIALKTTNPHINTILRLLAQKILLSENRQQKNLSPTHLQELLNNMNKIHPIIESNLEQLKFKIHELIRTNRTPNNSINLADWTNDTEEIIHSIIRSLHQYQTYEGGIYNDPLILQITNAKVNLYALNKKTEKNYRNKLRQLTKEYEEAIEQKEKQSKSELEKNARLIDREKKILLKKMQENISLFEKNARETLQNTLKDFIAQSNTKQLTLKQELKDLDKKLPINTQEVEEDYQQQIEAAEKKIAQQKIAYREALKKLNERFLTQQTEAINTNDQQIEAAKKKIAQQKASLVQQKETAQQDLEALEKDYQQFELATDFIRKKAEKTYQLHQSEIEKQVQDIQQLTEVLENTYPSIKAAIQTNKSITQRIAKQSQTYQTQLNTLKQLKEEKLRLDTLVEWQATYNPRIYIKDLLLNRVEQFEKKPLK